MRLPIAISRNKLRALPDTLCSGLGAGQLQSLNVDHNELVALPEQIGALTSLTRLSVYDNLNFRCARPCSAHSKLYGFVQKEMNQYLDRYTIL